MGAAKRGVEVGVTVLGTTSWVRHHSHHSCVSGSAQQDDTVSYTPCRIPPMSKHTISVEWNSRWHFDSGMISSARMGQLHVRLCQKLSPGDQKRHSKVLERPLELGFLLETLSREGRRSDWWRVLVFRTTFVFLILR